MHVNILYLKCLWKSFTNWSTTMISFEKSRTPKEQNKWGLTVNIEAVWWHTPYLMMFYLVENMVCEISKLSCISLQQTSSLWFPKKMKSKLIAQKCINLNKSMINWFCYDQIMKVFRVNIQKNTNWEVINGTNWNTKICLRRPCFGILEKLSIVKNFFP